MPERIADAPWLFWLLEGLHWSQTSLLRLWQLLGLGREVDGQPAWPWAQRVAGEHLLQDLGQARQLLWSLAAVAAALALLLGAVLWRRGRPWLLGGALSALVLAPWPSGQVVWAPAVPTSFHRNPVPFSDAAIARGAAHYQQLCVRCHGEAGNGQGPDAAAQQVWPPNFVGPLLWRRAEGDLLQAVRHGLHDAQGRTTMPGFAQQLSVEDSWAVLHFLRAQAAGQLLRATGNWAQPIALPDMPVHCHRSDKQQLRDWQGQRIRLVSTDRVQEVAPDPRMVTLWLPQPGQDAAQLPDAVDCTVTSGAAAVQALGWINGGDAAVQEVQLLADKAGWLRARNGRGAESWSEDDLLCRTTDAPAPVGVQTAEDGLTRILRRMDAEPLGYVQGGRVHGSR